MADNREEEKHFDFERCRAKRRTEELTDCETPSQRLFCYYSMPFGQGSFCWHPRRDEIIERTRSLQARNSPPANFSPADEHE